MAKPLRSKVLVTGGPTRAYIDDVRYLSNFSTGGLALEICRKLIARGHEVYAVIGPTALPFEKLRVAKLIRVETRAEMQEAVRKICKLKKPDCGIFSAAVLDFEPRRKISGKTKSKKSWRIDLHPSPKIIDAARLYRPTLWRVGFKLEWSVKKGEACRKLGRTYLRDKDLDVLCLNFLPELKRSRHPAHIFTKAGESFQTQTKPQLAARLVSLIELRP